MKRAEWMATERGAESVTVKVKLAEPTEDGTPPMTPFADIVNHVGPEVRLKLQVRQGCPFFCTFVIVARFAAKVEPFGTEGS